MLDSFKVEFLCQDDMWGVCSRRISQPQESWRSIEDSYPYGPPDGWMCTLCNNVLNALGTCTKCMSRPGSLKQPSAQPTKLHHLASVPSAYPASIEADLRTGFNSVAGVEQYNTCDEVPEPSGLHRERAEHFLDLDHCTPISSGIKPANSVGGDDEYLASTLSEFHWQG